MKVRNYSCYVWVEKNCGYIVGADQKPVLINWEAQKIWCPKECVIIIDDTEVLKTMKYEKAISTRNIIIIK